MLNHVVKQGESLASIAKKYGFTDWWAIYNHPSNADFKRKRPSFGGHHTKLFFLFAFGT
jgi:hypothetical protein